LLCMSQWSRNFPKKDAASATNGWQHPTTNLQVLLWTKQTPHSEILKDDFKSALNQAIHKWPLWTFFSKFYLKNMSSLFHIFCHMD
jgi:hypothetical protein